MTLDHDLPSSGPLALTTADLAIISEGQLIGPSNVLISGVAEVDNATSSDVTYAVNRSYLKRLQACEAGAAIVPKGMAQEAGVSIPLIEAENPYWSFAQLLGAFAPVVPAPCCRIHPSAVIDPTAAIAETAVVGPGVVIEGDVHVGDQTVIGAQCFLGHGSSVGERSRLLPGVVIHHYCRVGNDVTIHSGTIIGTDGYGFVEKNGCYHKIPQIGIVVIEDHVEIGSLVAIDRATIGQTVIGRGSKLDNLIQIGHNVEIGADCAFVAQVGISGSSTIGERCRFAGQAATSGHLTIGSHTTVAARGVVTKDLPPGSFVSGFPARPHRDELRTMAAMARLPDLLRRMRKLEDQLANLISIDSATQEESG